MTSLHSYDKDKGIERMESMQYIHMSFGKSFGRCGTSAELLLLLVDSFCLVMFFSLVLVTMLNALKWILTVQYDDFYQFLMK